MNTEEAAKLRAKLERDILKLLQDFQEATKLVPSSVEIVSASEYAIGEQRKQRHLFAVQVEVVL